MINPGVVVSAGVRIGGRTEITYDVFSDGLVEFSIGDGEFDLIINEPGLRNFVAHAQAALHAVQAAIAHNEERC